MNFLQNFLQQRRNAQELIRQFKAGEWKPLLSHWSDECLMAHRGNKVLWMGDGPTWLRIEYDFEAQCDPALPELPDYLGVWRYWAWWAGVRAFKLLADPVKPVEPMRLG